jgi:hypothetical protein
VLASSASTLSDEKPNVARDFRQVVVELVVPTVQAANHSLRKSLCVQLDVPKRHDFIVAAMVEKHGNPFRQPGAEIFGKLEIAADGNRNDRTDVEALAAQRHPCCPNRLRPRMAPL